MKKALSFLTACLLFQAASAQNGFYLAPSFSAGLGQISSANESSPQSGILSYEVSAGIGYQYKNWRFQSGLQYFKSGSRYKLSGVSDLNDPEGPAFLQQSYTHIGIPLLLGYTFFPQKNFHLVPILGLTTSYNINLREKGRGIARTADYEPFGEGYHRISFWGNMQLLAEYQVNNKITVFGGPALQYMLSNFNKMTGDRIASGSQRNYNINFELGVRMAF